jgi:hypothetical protein
MHKRIPRGLASEKAQSFAEFTLILPIALVLLLGVVDLGKATAYWLDSGHLANEGARFAVVQGCPPSPGCTPTDPTYATELLQALNAQAETGELGASANLCITDFDPSGAMRPAGAPWLKGDSLRVTISSPYNFLAFLHLPSVTVTGHSTMRLEKDWAAGTTPGSNPFGTSGAGSCT